MEGGHLHQVDLCVHVKGAVYRTSAGARRLESSVQQNVIHLQMDLARIECNFSLENK
jgi:hypothetical protein